LPAPGDTDNLCTGRNKACSQDNDSRFFPPQPGDQLSMNAVQGSVLPVPASPETSERIQGWIVSRLARLLGVKPEEIGVDDPLSDYGLESVEAIALSGELSDLLGRQLSPTLTWDHPTIADLARFLSSDTEKNKAESNEQIQGYS
jgi:acyl carrier protein